MRPVPLRPARFAWAALLAVIALVASGAHAGGRGDEVAVRIDPTEEEFYGGGGDYVLAQVLAVADTARAGHAARVRIEIIESLRGDLQPGVRLVAWPLVAEADRREWTDPEDVPPAGPLVGLPSAGTRVLLAGAHGADGMWVSDPHRRWSAADGNAARRRRRIEHWTSTLAAQHAADEQRVAADTAAAAAAQAKATQERFARESAWLAKERALRDGADVDGLVRTSDAVLLAAPLDDRRAPWAGQDFTPVRLRAWLLEPPGQVTPNDSLVHVELPPRERPVHARWIGAPGDDAPGDAVGESLHCVVFLRAGHHRLGSGGIVADLRFADPVRGVLWADPNLVRRVEHAVAARGRGATEPTGACGATFDEFVCTDTVQAAGVAMRIAPVSAQWRIYGGFNAFFFVPRAAGDDGPATNESWFAGCAYPESLYGVPDEYSGYRLAITASLMRALVDSLAAIPAVRAGRVDGADSLSLTLRRVSAHGERLFETTLDLPARMALARILARLFPADDEPGWRVRDYWTAIDPRLLDVWFPPPVERDVPPPLASGPPAVDDTCGAVVGFVENAVTGRALDRPSVRALFQDRWAMGDHAGTFAVSRLHPGWVWMEASALDCARAITLVRVDAGGFTPAVFRLTPRGAADPLRGRRTAPVAALAPFGAQLRVQVRDDHGKPAPHAWALLEATGATRGGRVDAHGALAFDLVPPGPARLLVRAPGGAPVARSLALSATARDTIDVALARDPYFTRR